MGEIEGNGGRRWSSMGVMDARPLDPGCLGLEGRPLYLAGALPPAPRLAVVGSRAATRPHRRAVARVLARCAARGWSLVSGGALGIDGDAHRAALELGVPQLAVLPCGDDFIYPPDHAPLFTAILAAGGGLLFPRPRGSEPSRWMFAARNELVVAAADAVLVGQAAVPSGSLRTGQLALRRDRPLAVLAGSPGAAALAARGACTLPLEEGLEDAVDAFLAGGGARGVADGAWPRHLWPLRDRLRAAGPAGLSLEELPQPGAALLALAEAEGLGLVVEVTPGRYLPAR